MTTLIPRLFGDLSDLFEPERPMFAGHVIRVEDSLTDEHYQIRAELPGLDPEKDIQVSVDGGVLSIHAERREQEKGKTRTEFRYGMLSRSVRLPGNADLSAIRADYDKGVLEVTVPLKATEPPARQITVNAK
ncbi:Hsp20/alpha crystallin family protein [Catellatospora sp. KI3]|uniref:Hsp20/alpha crystallin family protein n=1 Tax=Catellatospora sp. KI3 TaxID=3041620 RepID=UPI00248314D0|nr:Hsp20/alpha crystallin family protein [Catellatospora sp. KI3]MDI1464784.1 Hsp20/alpha crystallin family protein [Catellatospora sp. KI3]